MPAIIGGLIVGGASLAGGLMSSNAQSDAAKKAAALQEQALGFQRQIYGTAQTNLNPYIDTGKGALYSLSSLYGLPGGSGSATGATDAFNNFTNTPAYQFPLEQGLLGARRGLAASGLTGSGAEAKDLNNYAQGYASQGFQGYIDQLAKLAGVGQASAVSLAGQGNQTANLMGNTLTNQGNLLVGGAVGSANSMNQGIGGFLGALGNNNFGTSGASGSSFGPSSPFGQGYSALAGLFPSSNSMAGGVGAP
jgi:hypothetical protein